MNMQSGIIDRGAESFQFSIERDTMKTSTTYNEISGNLLFQSNGFISKR